MAPRSLIKVQAASGLVLALFVGLHLINVLLANFGPDVFVSVQRSLRIMYQHPAFELTAIAAALIIHVTVGVIRARRRRRDPTTAGPRPAPAWPVRINRWAAYFLIATVFGHALATRGPSLVYDVYPEFSGISFSLWWRPWLFYPYYFLLGTCGFYHLVFGVTLALGSLRLVRLRTLRPGSLWAIMVVSTIAMVGALLAFGGHTYATDSPTDNDYARIYSEQLGVQLP